jgi:long-chain acyl-CoA synthetase
MPDSFLKRVVDSFEQRSDKVAMRIVGDEEQVYSFGETLDCVRSVAWRIAEQGVAFGDRIALIGENHPCWAIAYLASIYMGSVCVPLDPHGEIETITNFLENSEAKLAFLGPDQTEKFKLIEERLGRHIPAVVWNESLTPRHDATPSKSGNGSGSPEFDTNRASEFKQSGTSLNDFHSFAEWVASEYPDSFRREVPKAAGDDIALLIYTSGTTGTPKGVPLTHANIVAELDGINAVLKLTDKEKILSLLPLFHAYLQIVNLWVATTYGCEVGYLKELSPAALGEAMKKFRPTILTTVPRLWYLFHKKIFDAVDAKPKAVRLLFKAMLAANGFLRDSFGVNVGKRMFGKVHESFGGRLRLAVSGGSRFDEDVAVDFHRLGFNILQGYGLTETSGAATATHEGDNRIGSVGKAMKGAEVKIDDPNTEDVGEVLIRGDMVFGGYYRNPTANAEAFTEDGWFRSGDLGRFDKDGHLYIVGRAKDVIVLPSGKNVHPEDIEIHYLKAPEVEELAVLGVTDDSEQKAGAEKLIAVVIPDFEYLKHAAVANSKEAIRYALDNLGRELPEYQRVRDYIVRVEPLPRTATRKIKRFQLKKEIESGLISDGTIETRAWTLSPDDESFLSGAVAGAVVKAIRQNVKEADLIHPDMNLEIDLGLDSLARAETFAALEHAFSTEFDTDEAAQALTVRDIVFLAEKHRAAEGNLDSPLSTRLNWSKILKETSDDLPEIRAVLRNRPFFIPFAFTVYKCFNLFCRVFMRLEVEGIEELKKMKRPFIICPNHQSYLDPFIVCSAYPYEFFKNTFHVGASMFFKGRIMKFVAEMLHVVPVNPDTHLMRAMKAGAIGLKKGKVLNIYPEGERAFDGNLHEFKKGAAIIATELDLPILPVALDGVHKVWARGSWKIRPAKVKVRFGKAFYAKDVVSRQLSAASGVSAALEPVSSISGERTYAAVTEHLKQSIADIIGGMRR